MVKTTRGFLCVNSGGRTLLRAGRILLCIMLIMICALPVLAEEALPTLDEIFGQPLPSVSAAIGREPSMKMVEEEKKTFVYDAVFESDYQSLDKYLADKNCSIQEYKTEGKYAVFSVIYDGTIFELKYNIDDNSLEAVYPINKRIDEKTEEYENDGGVLPAFNKLFIVEYPNMQLAIGRAPSSIEDNGAYEETYNSFTKDEYNKFSSYLQDIGCSIANYNVEDNIMTAELLCNESTFTFIYDMEKSKAVLKYPAGAVLEPVPTAVPAPEEKASVKSDMYSENECWVIAERYFNSLNWKNPGSVKIHDYKGVVDGITVSFIIDYSAQNGFGGYNRAYYYITVNMETGLIIQAFGT